MATALAVLLASCSQGPRNSGLGNSREVGAFSDPRYGRASPRVVGLDEDAPRGGGRYQVGRPYMVAGRRYVPHEKPDGFTQTGYASWYGIAFHGRKTANGEIYDRNMISAAHPTMPLPSYARVTNTLNNHSIVVRVNDRGPYHGNRMIDLSERTAGLLGFKHIGTARVRVDYLGPASLAGSDDARLVASLRTNGPAQVPGSLRPEGIQVASAAPVASPSPASPLPSGFTAQAPARATIPASFRKAPASAPGTLISSAQSSGADTASANGAARFTPAPDLPLPPPRPFDLDSITGALRPVASVPAPALQRLGTDRPQAAPVALALSDPAGLLTRFGATSRGEFHWIKTPLSTNRDGR